MVIICVNDTRHELTQDTGVRAKVLTGKVHQKIKASSDTHIHVALYLNQSSASAEGD